MIISKHDVHTAEMELAQLIKAMAETTADTVGFRDKYEAMLVAARKYGKWYYAEKNQR